MTTFQGKLCSAILLEHFGKIIKKVGDCLFKNGSQSLRFICVLTKLPLSKVKESLCVLIKYGHVFHEKTPKGIMYTLNHKSIVMILRYSRFMYFVKMNSGDEAEIMFEEILKQGYESASQVIIKTYQRILDKTNIEPEILLLKEKFELLTKNQFIMKCNCSKDVGVSPTDKPEYDMPKLNLKAILKMTKGETDDPGDNGIYWRVNYDRLVQDLRDQIVVQATEKMVDANAGELMRQLLILSYQRTAAWEELLNPIPLSEIRDQVKKNSDKPQLIQYLDQYLRIIEEESRTFLRRVGDSGGGQFSVNIKEAFAQLAKAKLQSIVMERFGSKAARIFNLIMNEKQIEIDKIQSLVMINQKEAKKLTFALVQESFVQMQEMKKPGTTTGIPSFFLFHVDMNQVVRMQIEHCHQALYNMNQRRTLEAIENKRVIDKYLRLQVLKNNIKAHGAENHEELIHDIDDTMTPAEKQQLEKVNIDMKVLSGGELKIDETLFLLSMYLRYH